MAMNEIAIEVKDLIKRYGEGETALCGVSFAVPRGVLRTARKSAEIPNP